MSVLIWMPSAVIAAGPELDISFSCLRPAGSVVAEGRALDLESARTATLSRTAALQCGSLELNHFAGAAPLRPGYETCPDVLPAPARCGGTFFESRI